jgi:lysine 2,3-aminomutase
MQYYVYQCDMVQGIEDLRTPLHEIITLDKEIRGTLSGFMMPSFVIDLPGGGGKRLVSTYEKYENGKATYRAPGLHGEKGTQSYTYYDPQPIPDEAWATLRDHKVEALKNGQTLEQVARAKTPDTLSDRFFAPVPMPSSSQDVVRSKRSQQARELAALPDMQSWERLTSNTNTISHL